MLNSFISKSSACVIKQADNNSPLRFLSTSSVISGYIALTGHPLNRPGYRSALFRV